jgi:hypothetical protein
MVIYKLFNEVGDTPEIGMNHWERLNLLNREDKRLEEVNLEEH